MAGAESRKISPHSPPRIRGSQGKETSGVTAARAGSRAHLRFQWRGPSNAKSAPHSPPRIRGNQGKEPSRVTAARGGDCLFPQSGICDKIRVFVGEFYSPRVFAKNFLEFSGQEAVEREKDKFVYSDEP